MKIVSAAFQAGAASARQFPAPVVPEIAFLGKSNVGKSSLINALLNRKNLVKTSATPGKTRQVNFFLINERFRFVDLPGYGFARAPKSEQAAWRKLCEAYLRGRANLRGVVMIVDIRHVPGPLDQDMKAWLDELGIPTIVAASKADKLSRSEMARALKSAAEALGLPEPPLAVSARTKLGRDEMWRRIGAWVRR
jgi:GTP-binding protein